MSSHDKPMSWPMRVVLAFVMLNALAGAVSLLLFPTNTDATFFWRIVPSINAALVGSFYLLAALAVGQAVIRGRWEPSRYLVPMILGFTLPMLLATLLHADRLVPGIRFYYWVGIYVVAPAAAALFYWQHEQGGANWQVVSTPVQPLTRRIALMLGALTALATLVSFIMPPLVTEVAPWPISPLMMRVFAAWLGAPAAVLLWFSRERDWGRLHVSATMMMAGSVLMLLIIAFYRHDLKPEASVSILVFCGLAMGLFLVGAAMHWLQRRAGAERYRLSA